MQISETKKPYIKMSRDNWWRREAGVFDYLLPPHLGAFGGLHPKKNRLMAEPGGGGGGGTVIYGLYRYVPL